MMHQRLRCALLCCVLTLSAAQADAPDDAFHFETIARDLEHPWSLAFLPDGGLLVTERTGRLLHIDPASADAPQAVVGLPDHLYAEGQAGLKEVAPAPDFSDTRLLYLSYTCGNKHSNQLCLARARYQDGRLDLVETILRTEPTRRGAAHYGGRIAFLPDGTLLLTHGDGFVYREEAQRPRNHLGSLLRLNPDGSPPADNPEIDADEAAPETWSYGHRNVQAIARDRATGNLYIAEHGPRGGDLLHRIEAGRNYGWPIISQGIDYTGARITPYTSLPGLEPALLVWTPALAPSDMVQYHGDRFPDWRGDLLVSGLAGKSVRRLRIEGATVDEVESLFRERDERIRALRIGPNGALYLLTDYPDGRLLRVTPDSRD